MVYVDVLVATSSRVETLTYGVTPSSIPYITVGCLVEVPLRRRLVRGVVVALKKRTTGELKGKMRQVERVIKGETAKKQLEIINFLTKKHAVNRSEIAKLALGSFWPQNPEESSRAERIQFWQGSLEWRLNGYLKFFKNNPSGLILFSSIIKAKRCCQLFKGSNLLVNDLTGQNPKLKSSSSLYVGTVKDSFHPLLASASIVVDEANQIGGQLSRRPYLRHRHIAIARAQLENRELILADSYILPADLELVTRGQAQFLSQPLEKNLELAVERLDDDYLEQLLLTAKQTIKNDQRLAIYFVSRQTLRLSRLRQRIIDCFLKNLSLTDWSVGDRRARTPPISVVDSWIQIDDSEKPEQLIVFGFEDWMNTQMFDGRLKAAGLLRELSSQTNRLELRLVDQESDSIRLITAASLRDLYRLELNERQRYSLPPFSLMVQFYGPNSQAEIQKIIDWTKINLPSARLLPMYSSGRRAQMTGFIEKRLRKAVSLKTSELPLGWSLVID